jgi:catechol 2,3-dioxygenase-like lactoylglutathione lyase family enzyme
MTILPRAVCRARFRSPLMSRYEYMSIASLRVHGVLEIALYVNDVKRSAEFYQRLFGFSVLLESERLIALNVADRSVLLLFKEGATKEPLTTSGGVIPGHGGTGSHHFAFSIASEDVMPWQQRLEAKHVTIESIVQWPGGAQSVYFRDPDDHLVELMSPGFWAVY